MLVGLFKLILKRNRQRRFARAGATVKQNHVRHSVLPRKIFNAMPFTLQTGQCGILTLTGNAKLRIDMHWHCDSHILRDEQPSWPMLADTALALVPNGTPDARLLIEERELAHNMGSQRLKDFTSGRHSAHIAQRLLGLNEQPVLRIDRSPQWPMGQCGSISHCRQWAFAGVSTGFRSIGVDVETIGRVTTKLYRTLFRPEEVTAMASKPELAAAIAFSAKEAGYKAIFPIGGTFIGFQEASIDLDWSQQQFHIRYMVPTAPTRR